MDGREVKGVFKRKRRGLESSSHHTEVGNVSTNIGFPIMHLGACVFAFPGITGEAGGSAKPP
eukprot:3616005-Ditylum_brightwellii.AAC.1